MYTMSLFSKKTLVGIGSVSALFLSYFLMSTFVKRHRVASPTPQTLEQQTQDVYLPPLSVDGKERTLASSVEESLFEKSIVPSYRGIVFDAISHFPIPDVCLFFQYAPLSAPLSGKRDDFPLITTTAITTTTDAHGMFSFSLEEGQYYATLHPPHPYTSESCFVMVSPYMEFFLHKGLTLEGIVQDTHGKPVSGASIFVLDPQNRDQKLIGNYNNPAAVTGIDGWYAISGINRFSHGSCFPSSPRSLQPVALFAQHERYYQLYSNSRTFSDLSTTHFEIPPIVMSAQLYAISLRFQGFCGSGETTAILTPTIISPQSPKYVKKEVTFDYVDYAKLIDVPPGSYYLDVTRDGCARWRTSFRILNNDISFNVSLVDGFQISGVAYSGNSPHARRLPHLNVTLTPVNISLPTFPFDSLETITTDDGGYTFRHLPEGTYRLSATYGEKFEKDVVLHDDIRLDIFH